MRSWGERWLLIAIRCTITSVSLVLWKIEPRASRLSRSWSALVRLPLWPMAIDPRAYSTAMGWAFLSIDPPAVE